MGDLLISVSGIRGIVGDSLTPETALSYGRAFGRYLKKGKVVMGRDTRYHGPMIFSAAASGVMDAGLKVVDIGVATTPAIEYAVKRSSAAGGIAITASHNPVEYNALKLIGRGGLFLTEAQSQAFHRYCRKNQRAARGTQKKMAIGSIVREDGWDIEHINAILALEIVSSSKIRRKKFRVVADCVNGTASYVAGELFNSLGCHLKLVNAVPDGFFPRPPEPTAENLGRLSRAVRQFNAHIGFAFDPDADRMAMVDEKGRPLGEEYTLALGLRFILSQQKGPVAVNLSSSMVNDFVAREAGVRLYRTRVGEINVTEKLRQVRGIAGGEGNGGLIYPPMHYGRDGLMAAVLMLQYLATTDKSISQLAGELPKTWMVKRKLELERRRISFSRLIRAFRRGKIDKRDGIKVILDDSWFQLRLSNTEPIARLITEAFDPRRAQSLADEVERLVA